MLSALIINLLKAIFGIFNSKDSSHTSEMTEEENRIFSVQLDARKKDGWIERIDYWIDKKNYDEAVKLCNFYTQDFFGFDNEISERVKRVNKLIKGEQ